MGKLLFLVALVFASVSIASAQNSDDWSGFYVGGNGFVSSDRTSIAATTIPIQQITNVFVTGRGLVVVPGTTVTFTPEPKRKTNFNGGGQVGYQWQSGKLVFGAEGDYSPFHESVTLSQIIGLPATTLTPPSTVVISRKVRFVHQMSARARIGYASGKTLVYGTGGYSYARIRVDENDVFTAPAGLAPPGCATPGPSPCFNALAAGPIIFTSSPAQNRHGWNAGGGVERRFNKRYSIGLEYRHTDLGSRTSAAESYLATYPTPPTNAAIISYAPTKISLKSDSFSVRFNFHF
jgi:outer membrane immunogenic protein